MIRCNGLYRLFCLLWVLLWVQSAPADEAPAEPLVASEAPSSAVEEGADKADETDEEPPKTIADFREESVVKDGLFTLLQNRETGATQLLIKADQLDREYIYFIHVADGVVDAGYFRGAYGPSFVFSLHKRFNKIELIQRNTGFYYDPDNAISRSANANISDAVLAVQEIVAVDEGTGEVLIDADPLFLGEAFSQISPTPNPDADPKRDFSVGELDASKTRILGVNNYPENTAVEVEYVFHNPKPLVAGSAAVTDPRNVSVRALHTLIQMPDNDYQSRFADARLGSFNQQVTDLTSTSVTPYRDVINRWHLVKKRPRAALSEPVEPITWWIENTTPEEWRPLIKDAALAWNKAFESAGFRNALVVKIQPDDADWDAGDIRYNVLRWTSSPQPPFGGYGPSFANPRTGQLLGADVMLEYAFMNRARLIRDLIQGEIAESTTGPITPFNDHYCALASGLSVNAAFARLASRVNGLPDELAQQMDRDTLYYLVLHELGHTLGMNHNMKATNLLTPAQTRDAAVVAERGLSGSVMDYPAINFAPTTEQQTLYYPIAPGPYDHWYIEYAYSAGLNDPAAEASRLKAIAARSAEPALAFGNDADDMRAPGLGMDPRVNIYDMSSDGIGYAEEQMSLMQDTLDKMAAWQPEAGESYESVYVGVGSMLSLWGRSADAVSRFVGGVYVDRSVVAQAGATAPFTPVEASRQRQAMRVLADHVFAPDALTFAPELLARTARERRGFEHFGRTEDPKIHEAVFAIQSGVLDHLLHPVVMTRITDTALYGNDYTLVEMMADLSDAVFSADISTAVNGFRQQLQLDYVQRLSSITNDAGGRFDTVAQSVALAELTEIRAQLAAREDTDRATRAHVQHLALVIDRALAING